MAQTAWFFDYDGSLCPHQEVWEERQYDAAEIDNVLQSLAASGAGVFWNTGRRVESLASVNKNFLRFSGYFIQGSWHWNAQNQESKPIGPILPSAVKTAYSKALENHRFLKLEIKATSLRIAPLKAQAMDDLRDWMIDHEAALASDDNWYWHVGHRGAEYLARGFDKGTALRREFEKAGSMQGRIPVAVGDDSLDRYAVVEALKMGGFAVLVGEGCGWITEVPHKPSQVIFCESPQRTQELISQCAATAR